LYCIEANDRHEASRGLFATAELLVLFTNKKLSCRRETARRFVSLNISLSLKITQDHSK